MSIKLHVKALPINRVAFSYSVLYELLVSLHVLDDYQHHPLHINWAVETMKQLPPDFRAEQRFFKLVIHQFTNLLWQPQYVKEPSYKHELQQFSEWPLDEFTAPFFMFLIHDRSSTNQRKILNTVNPERFLNDVSLQIQAKDWISQHYPDSLGIVDNLIDDPAGLKERFIDFINAYWNIHFGEKWITLEELFFQEVMQRGRLLYTEGALSALMQLSPRTRADYDAQTVIYVNQTQKEEIHLDQQSYLNLYPSYFLYPYMAFVLDNSASLNLSITYPHARHSTGWALTYFGRGFSVDVTRFK